jgi:hypothetical protein
MACETEGKEKNVMCRVDETVKGEVVFRLK